MEKLAYWCSLALVFTLPWERLVFIGPFGSLARGLGTLAAGVWLLKVLGDLRIRKPNALLGLMAVLLLWVALSLNWSADPFDSRQTMVTLAMLFVLAYMVWDLASNRVRLLGFLQAFVLGSLVPIYLVIQARLAAGADYRITAAGFHPNDLAMVLSLTVPFAGYLFVRGEMATWIRWGNLLVVPLAMFTTVMTGSRSGLLAASIGAAYVLILVITSLPPAESAVVGALLLSPAAFLPMVADRVLARLATTDQAVTTGFNGRAEIWTNALTIFNENPLFGTGAGAFESHTAAPNAPHNILISFGAELGVMGIVILVSLGLVLFAKALQAPLEMRALWLVALVGWGVNAMFHNIEHRKQTWLLFALVVVASELPEIHRSIARQPAAQSPPAGAYT